MDWAGVPKAMDLSKCSSKLEEWRRYKFEMGLFLDEPGRNQYPDCRKVAILMYCIGDEGIRIFNSFSFEKPEDKDIYHIVVNKFEAYFISIGDHLPCLDYESNSAHTVEKPCVSEPTLGYLISVSVVWAILSVSDAKISTCTVSVSMWKRL